ncbi:hypothetical protein SNOG_11512 [Parastagonospora nodorum SN15]|uniref:Uncharacterized protein n=1 Tax=Phaeosphaeria nodorum (strain SN15 / ATCC MYA-4574 / FGSC 10173) TaxID=321614 RepID=Q0U9Q2_PHANO|nr:hypothetical protein SNOG_11512 [Parastagonospora nodorum SN15]EAT81220.2 hypothetical protein SNOG_11512 [Parastagonospora nodorum SN15]
MTPNTTPTRAPTSHPSPPAPPTRARPAVLALVAAAAHASALASPVLVTVSSSTAEGARCGYSDDSSDCSSEDEYVYEEKTTRRQGVVIRAPRRFTQVPNHLDTIVFHPDFRICPCDATVHHSFCAYYDNDLFTSFLLRSTTTSTLWIMNYCCWYGSCLGVYPGEEYSETLFLRWLWTSQSARCQPCDKARLCRIIKWIRMARARHDLNYSLLLQ